MALEGQSKIDNKGHRPEGSSYPSEAPQIHTDTYEEFGTYDASEDSSLYTSNDEEADLRERIRWKKNSKPLQSSMTQLNSSSIANFNLGMTSLKARGRYIDGDDGNEDDWTDKALQSNAHHHRQLSRGSYDPLRTRNSNRGRSKRPSSKMHQIRRSLTFTATDQDDVTWDSASIRSGPRSLRSARPGLNSRPSYGNTTGRDSGNESYNHQYGSHHSTFLENVDHIDQGNILNQADERTFYDDFTTIDWVHDTINESSRQKWLQSLPGFRGRINRGWDALQGWVLITVVAIGFALIAYIIDISEQVLYDLKFGFCSSSWFSSQKLCCQDKTDCNWISWSQLLSVSSMDSKDIDLMAYIFFTVAMAYMAVSLTLRTKTLNPLNYSEGAIDSDSKKSENSEEASLLDKKRPKKTIYTAYGSGVPEVKTILSGFVIRKFLGSYTLFMKSIALIFSVSSGLNVGKEGPYVHLATCVGNISCRLFKKFSDNDLKRRQVLSAAASAGVALAFGSPLGGVLFSLEEVSYYFLPNQLFRIFFCAMMSSLFLKILNPYHTGRIVLFEVIYTKDWQLWEMISFVFIGICGGVYGALFCKFSVWWPKVFRSFKPIKNSPKFEVIIIACVTGVTTFFNRYTSMPVPELLFELARPCSSTAVHDLCPSNPTNIPAVVVSLSTALIIKIVLISITFGLKVPAGIYIPSMVVGALFGRIVGISLQYFIHMNPEIGASVFVAESVVPGTYAMIAAGAFLAGVTRMTVTLAVIMFELTGSLDHVLPFSIAILVSNWVANAIEPRSIYELLILKNRFPFLDNRQTVAFDSSLADLVTYVPTHNMLDISDSAYVGSNRLEKILNYLQLRGDIDGCIPLVHGKQLVGVIPTLDLEFALDKIKNFCEKLGLPELLLCKLSIKDSDVSRYHHFYLGSQNTTSSDNMRGLNNEQDSVDYFARPTRIDNRNQAAETSENNHMRSDDDNVGISERFRGPRSHVIETDFISELIQVSDLTPYIDRAPITMDLHSPLALVQMMFAKLGARVICVTNDGDFVGILHKKKFIDFCHENNER